MPDDETTPVPRRGQLSPREQKIAEGLALVRGGLGYGSAARECGIPVRSLYEAAQRVYVAAATREAGLESAEKRIEAQTMIIAEAAGDRVITALGKGDEVGKNDAVLYGIASDKIMRLRGLDRQQDRSGSALGEVMQRLADLDLEATVTVKPASRDSRAIDITPHEPHNDR